MGQLCNEDVILALDDESDSDDYTVSNGTSAISSVNLTLQIIKSNTSKRDRYEFTVNKMSLTVEIMWYTVFLLMLIIAIGGNVIVMWIVLAHRRMRTVTNYFLVNLSVADVMLSVFNCVFNFIYMIHEDWNFGLTYCAINNHVGIVTVASSVFTLTGISIDRYLAIVRPLKPRMSKRWAQVIILLIWFTSFLLGGPYLLYSRIVVYRYSGKVQRSCIVIWPDGQATNSKVDHIYNLVLFFLTYIIPMTAMVICYTNMGRELWGSRQIGEMNVRQLECIKSKRRVVKMFIIIVTIFAICWLPYHCYFICIHYYPETIRQHRYLMQQMFLFFYWLAMSNAMVNPLIYYWMNSRFRQYFKDLLCEWRCFYRRNSSGGEGCLETPPMINHRYLNSQSCSRSGTNEEYNSRHRLDGNHFPKLFRNKIVIATCHHHPAMQMRYSKKTTIITTRCLCDMDRTSVQQHQNQCCLCHHLTSNAEANRNALTACLLQMDGKNEQLRLKNNTEVSAGSAQSPTYINDLQNHMGYTRAQTTQL
uniref:Tachykinin-like peptides receptor 86C n=3 Tax=Cacopsylla melanoneura TaxID=428564 RepID=A0A8D9FJG2_9HEMI